MSAIDYIGAVTAPTRTIAQRVVDNFELPHYGDPYNGPVMWGKNSGGGEHGTGRALDIMIRNSQKIGDIIAEWLWKNRRIFGLIHMIWKQRIKSTRVSPGVWRWMEDRGSATNNHMDHIHVLFDGRSIKSGGTQDVPFDSPKVEEEKFYQPKGVDMTVKQIQAAVKVTVDGYYGEDTKKAVARMQDRLDVPIDGYWGPVTEEAYEDWIDPKPEPGGATRAPEFPLQPGHWYGPESDDPRNHSGYWRKDRPGIRRYQKQMKGVREWQGMGKADGVFGEKTEAVTKKFQRQKGLKVDGLVGPKTWRAAWEEPIT